MNRQKPFSRSRKSHSLKSLAESKLAKPILRGSVDDHIRAALLKKTESKVADDDLRSRLRKHFFVKDVIKPIRSQRVMIRQKSRLANHESLTDRSAWSYFLMPVE